MKEKRNAKENHETETEGTNGNQAAVGVRLMRPIDETNERTIRCLDEIAGNALKAAKAIVPKVADVKSHPLPAFENLVAAPVPKRTLGSVVDEMANYLDEEMRYFVPGMAHGLEDFFVWWQGGLVRALSRLAAKKIAVCDTLGKKAEKQKILMAMETLPSFEDEAYAEYVDQIRNPDGGEDPTETIVRQWLAKEPARFPPPEEFRAAMRRALQLDAEATDEINENAAKSNGDAKAILEKLDEGVMVRGFVGDAMRQTNAIAGNKMRNLKSMVAANKRKAELENQLRKM